MIEITITDEVSGLIMEANFNRRKDTIKDSITDTITADLCQDNFNLLKLDDGTYQIISVIDNTITEITVPDYVSIIGNNAFRNCTNLINVIIGNNVKVIGRAAFEECENLKSITIPDSISIINSYTFSRCTNLTDITIGNSVKYIDAYAFDSCKNLKSLNIPDNVKTIGKFSFFNCSKLSELNLGNGVMCIDEYAFASCAITTLTLPESVIEINYKAFSCCFGLTEIYNLSALNITKGSAGNGEVAEFALDVYSSLDKPSKIIIINDMLIHTNRKVVTLARYLGDAAEITIPDYVTHIGLCAFYNCADIVNVTVPDSVKIIGDSAFYNCENLTTVRLGKGITTIEKFAFSA